MAATETTPLLADSGISSSSVGGSTLVSSSAENSKFVDAGLPLPSGKVVDPTIVPTIVRSRPLKETMSRARLVVILAGLWSSNFAFALQSTAIPTLAPTIAGSFERAELATYLGSIFTLANTAGIPVYGVLIDALGRRFAMLTACAFYGVGSAACAMAPSMWALVAARGLTGLGGGGVLAVSAVICTDLVALHERGFYQGLMMTVFGIGATLGGPTSGYLADNYGWPLAFWSQVPVVLFCATVIFTFLPEPPIPPTHTSLLHGLLSLDWAGVILLLMSTGSLILGLSFHTSFSRPWSHPSVYGLLLTSVVSFVVFVWNENRAARPIVPMNLFKTAQLRAIWSASVLTMIATQSLLFQVPTYFAVLMDMPATDAGWVLSICSGLGLSSGTLLAGYHMRRGGRYTGLAVAAIVPLIVGAWTTAMWKPDWPSWSYYATIGPLSTGYAVYLCVSLIALISSVDSPTMPKATALLYTIRSLGTTLGVSLGGSIQVGSLVRALTARFGDVPGGAEIIDAVVHSKAAIRRLPERYAQMALDSYSVSLSTVWVASGCVGVLALVCASFIRQNEIGKGDSEGRDRARAAESEGTA